MSACEGPLVERSPLAGVAEAVTGWRAPDDRLTLAVSDDLSAALVTVASGRGADLASAAVERLGAPLPTVRSASFSGPVTIVSAERGRYLVTKKGRQDRELAALVMDGLPGVATAVDHTDQLLFMVLEGPAASRALAALCSVDFDPRVFREGAAVVARLHDVRAHIWREAGGIRYMVGVQRSLAAHAWEALLEACKAHAATP